MPDDSDAERLRELLLRVDQVTEESRVLCERIRNMQLKRAVWPDRRTGSDTPDLQAQKPDSAPPPRRGDDR